MPLTTLIVDDEQLARDELAYLLKSVEDVEVVAAGKNGLEAISSKSALPTWFSSTCRCPASMALA